MNPEGSLLCSQEPATRPHSEPVQSNDTVSFLFILILSSHIFLDLPSGLFPSGSLAKILYVFLISYACSVLCPSQLLLTDVLKCRHRRGIVSMVEGIKKKHIF
jgi:hypothetical protein